jgi:hypothetical protein
VLYFPGVAPLQPFVGDFHLPAVHDLLVENAELVAQSVAHGRDLEGGQGIEVAGRQAAQAAVSQARLLFLVQKGLQAPADFGKGLFHLVIDAQVHQIVSQVRPRQKFRRQVAHHLDFLFDEAL